MQQVDEVIAQALRCEPIVTARQKEQAWQRLKARVAAQPVPPPSRRQLLRIWLGRAWDGVQAFCFDETAYTRADCQMSRWSYTHWTLEGGWQRRYATVGCSP